MNESQRKQKEEAREKAMHDSYCVNATGQRVKEMKPYEGQINNK